MHNIALVEELNDIASPLSSTKDLDDLMEYIGNKSKKQLQKL
jgi:hypothetical protein